MTAESAVVTSTKRPEEIATCCALPRRSAQILPSWPLFSLLGVNEDLTMDKRLLEFFEQYVNSLKAAAPAYGELYFDHLYSEYLVIRPQIKAVDSLQLMDGIHRKRTSREEPLTWNDIY
jgi:hypothetical protein